MEPGGEKLKDIVITDKGETILDSLDQAVILAKEFLKRNNTPETLEGVRFYAKVIMETGYKLETLELLDEIRKELFK